MKLGIPIVALSLLLAGAALADEPTSPDDREPAQDPPASIEPTPDDPGHLEILDDPPAPVRREDLATDFAEPVVRGNFRSIQVNVDAAGANILGDAANEPSLAIDPTNPDNLVIGWRQFDTVSSNFRQAGMAYSHDGGETWTFPGVLQPGQFRSDPVLAADSQGVFYYYSLSTTTNAEMFVSTDKGVTWVGPISAFGGDKTWMAADTTGGQGNDHVYTIWNSQFTCCAQGTDFTRSTDGGRTYDGPYSMARKAKWGTVHVGPAGLVTVAGTRTTAQQYPPAEHLLLTSSNAQDALATPIFEQITPLEMGGTTGTSGTPNPGGLLGQVWVAVDRSGGATGGNVYVLGSVNPPGADPQDVMFLRSTDGGATFTGPRRIHEPVEGAWQWFGTMSVAPTGRIDVVWNDTRIDPSGVISEVYYAYSTDAGDTWSEPLPVTPAWNSVVGHPNQNKIGDYYHMVSYAEGAALAYSATFNGEQDVYFLRVGDCNANGQHDADDLAAATSDDCDFNGVPDECQGAVVCLGCDNDGTCDRGESCESCPADCVSQDLVGCGNGICEEAINEDCVSCPADCNGVQKGNPGAQFCCGGGGGVNPVGCADARCTSDGFDCSAARVPASCCGDDFCDGIETASNCFADCVVGTPGEAASHDLPSDQMRITAFDPGTGVVDVTYTPACDATDHTVYTGDLAFVSSYGYEDAACNLGATGVASFAAGDGDRFFLIVGNDTTREGSYGPNSAGNPRPEDVGTPGCDLPAEPAGVICE